MSFAAQRPFSHGGPRTALHNPAGNCLSQDYDVTNVQLVYVKPGNESNTVCRHRPDIQTGPDQISTDLTSLTTGFRMCPVCCPNCPVWIMRQLEMSGEVKKELSLIVY